MNISKPYSIQRQNAGIRWSREINGFIYEFQYLDEKYILKDYRNTVVVHKIRFNQNEINDVTVRVFRNVTRTNLKRFENV